MTASELFLEFPAESCGFTGFEAVITSLVRQNAGFKLRCGGVTADAVPSVEMVACVLASCRDNPFPRPAAWAFGSRTFGAGDTANRNGTAMRDDGPRPRTFNSNLSRAVTRPLRPAVLRQ